MKVSWKHIGIFACIIIPLVFVAWLIHVLSQPAYWCGIIVSAGKAAGLKPLVQDCTPILMNLIDKLGIIALVLVVSAAIGLLTWIIIGLRANLSFRGPMGWGGDVHADAPQPAATVTTTTAVTTPTPKGPENAV